VFAFSEICDKCPFVYLSAVASAQVFGRIHRRNREIEDQIDAVSYFLKTNGWADPDSDSVLGGTALSGCNIDRTSRKSARFLQLGRAGSEANTNWLRRVQGHSHDINT
jgi:hypothetical protein